MEAAELVVRITGDIDDIERKLDRTAKAATSFSDKFQNAGIALTKTLTPAAIAAGGAFGMAFKEFDSGADTLIAKTGASGKALDSLEASMKKVAGSTTSGFGQVGSVLGDLNVALGLAGKPLEDLGGQIVKLQEMGQKFDTSSFTRFLGDWGVATDDAGAALDRLHKIGQTTGVEVGKLMDLTVQFGAPMRALGFSVDESTALIAKFTKEGVNTEAVLAGMKVGLGKMAAAGEAPAETFNRLVAQMKSAATEGDAMAIAVEAFGVRAGPDLATAVREGRFGVDELTASVANSAGAVANTYKATLDWSDKLEMLKNKVIGVVGPVGEFGMGIAGVAAGAGPLIAGVGTMIPALMSFAVAAWAAVAPLLPWILAIGAVIAIGVLLVKNWDTIKAAAGAAWDWIWEKVGGVVEAIKGFLSGLIDKVTGFVQEWGILLLGPIGAIWKFRDQIGETIGKVVDFFIALPGRIITAIASLADKLWDSAWEAGTKLVNAVREKLDEAVDWMKGLPGRVVDGLGNLASLLWEKGQDIVRGLIDGIKNMAGKVVDALLGLIPGPLKKFANLLGINSPSKVFAGFGMNIGEGLVAGVARTEALVARATADLARAAIQPAGLTISPSTQASSFSLIGAPAAAASAIDYRRMAEENARALVPALAREMLALLRAEEHPDAMHVAREIAWRTGG